MYFPIINVSCDHCPYKYDKKKVPLRIAHHPWAWSLCIPFALVIPDISIKFLAWPWLIKHFILHLCWMKWIYFVNSLQLCLESQSTIITSIRWSIFNFQSALYNLQLLVRRESAHSDQQRKKGVTHVAMWMITDDSIIYTNNDSKWLF